MLRLGHRSRLLEALLRLVPVSPRQQQLAPAPQKFSVVPAFAGTFGFGQRCIDTGQCLR